MCLLFVSWRQHPDYPILVAANRDERYQRATEPLALRENGTILCGLDRVGGGTWLGIRKDLRFCCITNFRVKDPKQPDVLSRGHIVLNFLLSEEPVELYLKNLMKKVDRYAPFNVLAGDRGQLYFLSSREKQMRKLSPGFFGLSNGLLDEPWPKVVLGKKCLGEPLLDSGKIAPGTVFNCLQNRYQPMDEELPDTGVGLERERLLAPIFISGTDYGTRSSALIQADSRGRVDFYEQSYIHKNGQPAGSDVVHCTLNV